MEKLKTKFNSIIYNFKTEDRYAGFKSHQKRVISPYQNTLANGSTAYMNASLTDYPEDAFDPNDEFKDAVLQDATNEAGLKEVELAWSHINKWISKNQPDAYEALSSPCTTRDIMEAQKDLKITFPACVARSLQIHDGQDDTPGASGGLIFGLELMDLDSIVKMTKMWRKVAEKLHNDNAQRLMMTSINNMSQPALSHTNSSNLSQTAKINNMNEAESSSNVEHSAYLQRKHRRHIPRQRSVPPEAIQPIYTHANWIPILTDNAGNHVGIDLAPGPKGNWGQVILFGREFDTKFVVAPTWGDFLLIFANDLELMNWRIEGDDDSVVGNGVTLIYNDRKTGKDQEYMTVLVQRGIAAYRKQAQLEKKIVKPTRAEKLIPRTPDLIDASSPVVKELEVFPDTNNKNNNNNNVIESPLHETTVIENKFDEEGEADEGDKSTERVQEVEEEEFEDEAGLHEVQL